MPSFISQYGTNPNSSCLGTGRSVGTGVASDVGSARPPGAAEAAADGASAPEGPAGVDVGAFQSKQVRAANDQGDDRDGGDGGRADRLGRLVMADSVGADANRVKRASDLTPNAGGPIGSATTGRSHRRDPGPPAFRRGGENT